MHAPPYSRPMSDFRAWTTSSARSRPCGRRRVAPGGPAVAPCAQLHAAGRQAGL